MRLQSRQMWLLVASMLALPACGGDDDDVDSAVDAGALDGAAPDGGPDASVPDEAAPLFEPDRLLEIEIELDPADWDVLRHQHHDARAYIENCPSGVPARPYSYFPATVRIDGETIDNVGIRKKGFVGSVTPVRPSLKISFDEYEPDRTYLGLDRLTLNNNRQDPSQANACLSYRIFREAGVAAPRCNFAVVTVNGQALGVYSNVESLRRGFLRQNFGDDSGNLYEGAIADFRPVWVDNYESKPGNDTDRSDLQALVDALAPDDADVESRLEPILDVDAFLTFWATEVLVGHWDGYAGNRNNHYIYRDPSSGRFFFIPWGPDSAFVHDNPFLDFAAPPSVRAVAMLTERLYDQPALRARYQARLQELLDQVWDEDALVAEVDRIEQMLADHVTVDPASFAAGLQRIRDYVTTQRQQVEADIARNPEWPGERLELPCMHRVGTATGTLTSDFGMFPAANPFTAGTGTLELIVDGVAQEFSQIGVSAGPFGDPSDLRMAVAVLGLRQNLTFAAPAIAVDPDLFVTGATLDVDLYGAAAQLVEGEGDTLRTVAWGLGSLDLEEVDATEGGSVTASFDLQFYWF